MNLINYGHKKHLFFHWYLCDGRKEKRFVEAKENISCLDEDHLDIAH